MDTLRFYLVTWNVATKPPGQDLNSLFDFPSQFNSSNPLPDFYIFGLQEVKSQPQNRLLDALLTDPWTTAANTVLCRQGFVNVKTIRLQGLLLTVYALIKHVPHLRGIESQFTKTGLGGMWGNKGAVSVRFNIYGCSVCLVNAHLTAHDHLLNDRIHDYNTIIRTHTYHVREFSNILFHDYVFWLGDLNFRTDHPTGNNLTPGSILTKIEEAEKDNYSELLEHDQLLACMKNGAAFSEFTEPTIHFPPTYKFEIGSDRYDLKRKPSWTDRILYKVGADNYENVTLTADLIKYINMPQYLVSDHKPVVAQYSIKVRSGARPPLLRSRSVRSIPVVEYPAETMVDCEQLLSNYTERVVSFAPMNRVWYVGDSDFTTQITLSPDVQVYPNDWIGIYDADFQSLDDYITYEYLSKVSVTPRSGLADAQLRTITLSFPLGSGVRTPGFYRFIYFSQPSSDLKSVLGISEPFEVSSKEERRVRNEMLDMARAGPSTRMSSHSPMADFSALDVANLSRLYSNDLNID